MRRHPITFGSLFAGVGGFDLGFERAGMACRWQVEIDPYCRRVLSTRFPGVRQWDDVRTFPPPAWVPCTCCDDHACTLHARHAFECPDDECPSIEEWESDGLDPYNDHHPLWRPDVICGGDPCQENSGARTRDHCTQSSLGDEFVRVVAALRPRIVVRENPTFTRADAPWPWWRMRAALESLGYAVLPFRLRACCLGADHQRDRLFLLAELPDAHGQRLEGWQAEAQSRVAGQPPRRVHAADWFAVSASRGLRSRDGFPDYVDRVKAVGNAVYPDVAEWIGRRIVEALTPRQQQES